MRKYFITGIPGTGKSTIGEKLQEIGIPSIDLDKVKDLCRWINTATRNREYWSPGKNPQWFEENKYICNKEMLLDLINAHQDKKSVVVVGFCDNQDDILPLFEKIFLLQCNKETFLKRIKTRTNHDFGKHELEKEMILNWHKDFEKEMLLKGAIPIDAEQSLESVVETIIKNISS